MRSFTGLRVEQLQKIGREFDEENEPEKNEEAHDLMLTDQEMFCSRI